MADEIAERVGIFTDSDYRIKAGILYTLLQASVNGHTYLPQEELLRQASELLKVEPSDMEKHLMDMQIDRKIVVKQAVSGFTAQAPLQSAFGYDTPGPCTRPIVTGPLVYSSQYYYLELNTDVYKRQISSRVYLPAANMRLAAPLIPFFSPFLSPSFLPSSLPLSRFS